MHFWKIRFLHFPFSKTISLGLLLFLSLFLSVTAFAASPYGENYTLSESPDGLPPVQVSVRASSPPYFSSDPNSVGTYSRALSECKSVQYQDSDTCTVVESSACYVVEPGQSDPGLFHPEFFSPFPLRIYDIPVIRRLAYFQCDQGQNIHISGNEFSWWNPALCQEGQTRDLVTGECITITPTPTPTVVPTPPTTQDKKTVNRRLTQAEADKLLIEAGITTDSTGKCTDRKISTCTSLEGIRQSAIDGVIYLKEQSGVDIVITGGTEIGHTKDSETKGDSHTNGFSLDMRDMQELTDYIQNNFEQVGETKIGDPIYLDPLGNTYTHEINNPSVSPHWHGDYK